MDIAKEILSKNTIDLIMILGAVVASIILILVVLMLFFKVARVEKIGLGGIECDPEDEIKTIKKTATRKPVTKKR